MIPIVILYSVIILVATALMWYLLYGNKSIIKEENEEKTAKRSLLISFIFFIGLLFAIPLFYNHFPEWIGDWDNYEGPFYGGIYFLIALFVTLMFASMQEISNIKAKREYKDYIASKEDIRRYIDSTKPEKVIHIVNSYNKLLELKNACDKEPSIKIPILDEAIEELNKFLVEKPNSNCSSSNSEDEKALKTN